MESKLIAIVIIAFLVLNVDTQKIKVVKKCPTIADIIHSYAALTELSSLLNQTTLNTVLGDPSLEITFFAPVNYAFVEHFSETISDTAKTPVALEQTMRMHMLPKPITLMELESGEVFTTNSTLGQEVDLTIDISDVDILVLSGGSIAAVVDGDVVACKSVIHFVNSVLTLPRPILLLMEQLHAGGFGASIAP